MKLYILRLLSRLYRILKRLFVTGLVVLLLLAVATVVVVQLSGDDQYQYAPSANLVNDITGLNPVHVGQVVRPETVADIANALRTTTGPVSIGGGRFSQGGQVAYPDSLHLDMRSFNQIIALDVPGKRITVQPGITWRAIQQEIDEHDLSIRIMQTYANFTVGGSLSVNVHGRYVGEGPLVRSVESLALVLADGSIVTASPVQNAPLFYGAIGGYGGLGVIVEATLQLADNVRVERQATRMPLSEYREHFVSNIAGNDQVIFHNADLYPPDYDDLLDVTWYKTDKPLTIAARLRADDEKYYWQPKLAAAVSSVPFGEAMREHVFDRVFYFQDRVVWRNWEASYDVAELEPASRKKTTYVLREYFVPVAKLESFVATMGDIFRRHDANILNVSIRHALPDPGTYLAWADEEVYALVVYYRQGTGRAAQAEVDAWSSELIDAVIATGGTYYLPYQLSASQSQFEAAYPRAGAFFELKNQIDPNNRFRNLLWERYYPPNREPLAADKAAIDGYLRGEEQTFLTLPEWYLVFNPLEYADYLQAGHNPSDFPFKASIDEYWTLYDRVRVITEKENYPANNEYITMLRVIGFSTTAEYILKGAYEHTVGRLTRWMAGGRSTPEDAIITAAHRAYSDLIFDEAWYQFDFAGWIGKIWRDTDFLGKDFVRKLERKVFFTLEFGAKELYARLIGYASKAAYGAQEPRIYFTATAPARSVALPDNLPADVTVSAMAGDTYLMSVPRWGPFTERIPLLAAAGYDFADISGNERIVVTLIATAGDAGVAGNPVVLPGSQKLFNSRIVSDPSQQRLVMLVNVDDLREFLTAASAQNLQLEHLYDY